MEGQWLISCSSGSEVMQDTLQWLILACFIHTTPETLYSDIVTSLWKAKLTQMFSFVWTLLKTPFFMTLLPSLGCTWETGSGNSKTSHTALIILWCDVLVMEIPHLQCSCPPQTINKYLVGNILETSINYQISGETNREINQIPTPYSEEEKKSWYYRNSFKRKKKQVKLLIGIILCKNEYVLSARMLLWFQEYIIEFCRNTF